MNDHDRPATASRRTATAITVIDLDRTITRRGTYTPFLLHAAWRVAPWRLLAIPIVVAAMLVYRCGLLRRRTLKQIMHRALLGHAIESATIARIADGFAARIVGSGLNRGVRRLIARERREGRTIVLATAAHRFYAEAIAQRLGIDHVVATESVRRGGVLLSTIAGENCYGAAKAHAVADFLAGRGVDRRRASIRCYSDDISDLPLFEMSDEPIGFHPSATLRRACERRGWPVVLASTRRRGAGRAGRVRPRSVP